MFLDMQKYRTTSKRNDAICIWNLFSFKTTFTTKLSTDEERKLFDKRVLDFFYYVYLLTELSRRKQYQKTNDLALVYGLVCLGVIKIGGMIINFFFWKVSAKFGQLSREAEHRSNKSKITVYVDAVSLILLKKQTNESIQKCTGVFWKRIFSWENSYRKWCKVS